MSKFFTEIESFRHVVRRVRDYCKTYAAPLPFLEFIGTVKLHGTNAGISFADGAPVAKSRSRVLTVESDNFGFAAHVHRNRDLLSSMLNNIAALLNTSAEHVTLFGEWVGKGVQDTVAVSQLHRHFVIFGVHDAKEDTYHPLQTATAVTDYLESIQPQLVTAGINYITQVPTYKVKIDFANPDAHIDELESLTVAVESECPWGRFHGVTGIGEGIVWVAATRPYDNGLWFKTKGLKHSKKDKPAKKLSADPAKVAFVSELVNEILPEWRLEQGISQLAQDGLAVEPKNTGPYLKWICQDILKEETDVITANGFAWKDVQGQVCQTARQYFLKKAGASFD